MSRKQSTAVHATACAQCGASIQKSERRPREYCSVPCRSKAKASRDRAKKDSGKLRPALYIVRNAEPCNGRRTFVCPRTDCFRNCAYESGSNGVALGMLRCSLAVADEGEHTMDEVAEYLGVTANRVQQIEEDALAKLRHFAALKEHTE